MLRRPPEFAPAGYGTTDAVPNRSAHRQPGGKLPHTVSVWGMTPAEESLVHIEHFRMDFAGTTDVPRFSVTFWPPTLLVSVLLCGVASWGLLVGGVQRRRLRFAPFG